MPRPRAQPASPEELAARYAGRWTIRQERYPDGTYGDWRAESCQGVRPVRKTITARNIASLANKLAKAES